MGLFRKEPTLAQEPNVEEYEILEAKNESFQTSVESSESGCSCGTPDSPQSSVDSSPEKSPISEHQRRDSGNVRDDMGSFYNIDIQLLNFDVEQTQSRSLTIDQLCEDVTETSFDEAQPLRSSDASTSGQVEELSNSYDLNSGDFRDGRVFNNIQHDFVKSYTYGSIESAKIKQSNPETLASKLHQSLRMPTSDNNMYDKIDPRPLRRNYGFSSVYQLSGICDRHEIQEYQKPPDTEPLLPVTGEKDGDTSLTAIHKLTIAMMCMVNFFTTANFSILAPILPAEAVQKKMSTSQIGFLIGIPCLTMFLLAPICGRLVGKVGAKFMLIGGMFIYSIDSLLFGVLEYSPPGWPFIIMCFLVRTTQAVAGAAMLTTTYTIIASMFPDRVTTYFGLMESFSGVGYVSGPPIGGILYQVGGFGLSFYLIGGALLLCAIIGYCCIPQIPGMATTQSDTSVTSFVLRPGTAMTLYALFCCSFGPGFLQPTLSDYLKNFNLESYQVGLMFVIYPGVYCIAGPLCGYVCDKKGYVMSMMMGGGVIGAVAFVLMGPAPFLHIQPNLWLVVIAIVCLGVCGTIIYIPSFAAIFSLALDAGYPNTVDTSGMASGLFLGFYCFGGFMGASTGGMMVDHIGFPWACFITATLYVLNVVFMGIYAMFKRSKGEGQVFKKVKPAPTDCTA